MRNLFPGFTKESFEFFMLIRLNNNKPFFDENKEHFERVLKEPLYALAEDMQPFMQEVDKNIDTRPSRAVSRIRRSTRYRRDLSPYRDHLWVSWRDRTRDEEDSAIFTFYFSIEFDQMYCGSGYYNAKPGQMKALRKRIEEQPERFERIAKKAEKGGFSLHGDDYVRISAPESLPEICAKYYTKKSFHIEKELPIDEEHMSVRLPDILKENFSFLKDMYEFVNYG
ncbi:MAG: DUF2461 family protein [Christensenellales bacterium]|jgi:uncharacterized protein (TIGR02453 family)